MCDECDSPAISTVDNLRYMLLYLITILMFFCLLLSFDKKLWDKRYHSARCEIFAFTVAHIQKVGEEIATNHSFIFFALVVCYAINELCSCLSLYSNQEQNNLEPRKMENKL